VTAEGAVTGEAERALQPPPSAGSPTAVVSAAEPADGVASTAAAADNHHVAEDGPAVQDVGDQVQACCRQRTEAAR